MSDRLVTTDWLATHLDDPSIRIIEVDEDVTAYHRRHIPGALAWDWAADLHHPIQRDFVSREGLGDLLAVAGVGPDTTVILYGGNSNWFAAYAYWLLRYRGFDNAKLLDGGRLKWNVEERPTTDEVPVYDKTDFVITGPERPQLRALREHVLASLDEAAFVDVRSPAEYSGATLAPEHLPQEQPYVGGHIPGAVNVPWAGAAGEDGSFRSVDELRRLYADAGVHGDRPTIAYCRIGERSSHTWFVLSELLGFEDVRNYDGSWTEYGSLVGAPVER